MLPLRVRAATPDYGPLPALVIDTREQLPLDFGPWGVEVVTAGLPTGDYSLVGLEDRIALERKSLPDLYGCVGHGRERFEHELARLAEYDYGAILVEAALTDVLAYQLRTRVSPRAVVGSLMAWSVDYGLPVWFCDNHRLAAAVALKLLRKFYKHAVAEPAGMAGRSKL